MKFIRQAVVAVLMVLAVAATCRADIVMLPYLQGVTANSIYVLAECSSTEKAVVDFGETAAYGKSATTESTEPTTADPATYVHNIRLTGLSPDTTYHYRVRQGSSTSPDRTFRTAPLQGNKFRFAWMADCRTGTSIHDSIAAAIRKAGPAFSLYGGDLSDDPRYATWKREFFIPRQLALISEVPFFNTPGNHERWGTNTRAFTQAPTDKGEKAGYYSVDYGDLHILVLNTELPYGEGSVQFAFAAQDLAASTQKWKIVIAHKPAYCSGGHGDNTLMKELSTKVFEPAGVDMVLGGDTHFYQHNLVNGIHHMVVGTSGAPLYTPEDGEFTLKSVKDYSYAIFDVTPMSLQMKVYSVSGNLLDTVTLERKPAAKQ